MRDLRRSLGLTQGELARHARLSQGSVSRLENGRNENVAALVILKFTEALARQCRRSTRHGSGEALTALVVELAGAGKSLAIALGGPRVSVSYPSLPVDSGRGWDRAAALDGQRGVLRREGGSWTIEYQGSTRAVRDCKGLRYVAYLLRSPGRAVPATALLAHARADDQALPQAPQSSDFAAHPASDERARISVTRAIWRALARVAAVLPALGGHLDATIRTGIRCTYRPDVGSPVTWEVIEMTPAPPDRRT